MLDSLIVQMILASSTLQNAAEAYGMHRNAQVWDMVSTSALMSCRSGRTCSSGRNKLSFKLQKHKIGQFEFSLHDCNTIQVKTLCKRLYLELPVAARSVADPTNASAAGHTHSCAFKDCYSNEEQQHNKCCCGQAHDGDPPDGDAALFLWVVLWEEKHCFTYTEWSSALECLPSALYL